jgi:nitrogen regulatory protein P-II 1
MKEIKAFIHKDRISEVIAALNTSGCRSLDERAGCRNINVAAVQSLINPSEGEEQHYSMELAEAVVREWKLELFCEDEQADQLVQIIAQAASIGRGISGWIFVTEVVNAVPILGPSKYDRRTE